jgi:hypothetical protein
MIIKFGLEIGDQVFPSYNKEFICCDEHSLLTLLEKLVGIGSPDNLEFLRIEQYRQVLQQYLLHNKHAFFANSFEADALATAEILLHRRDELKLAGFNFEQITGLSTRIETFCSIEKMLKQLPSPFFAAYADRFEKLMESIDGNTDIDEICLNEPLELLPPHIKRLFSKLSASGTKITENELILNEDDSDLNNFKKLLNSSKKSKFDAKGDASLIVFECSSDSYAAAYLAKLFAVNNHFKPLCILPEKNRTLDNAIIQEGLPSFGVLSASLSRPTLQILKLAPVFLWNPINPYKLLEFLSLPNIPLNKGLAFRLAAAVSEKPGMINNLWFAKKNDFFNDLDLKIEAADKKDFLLREKRRAEKDYKFWFERKRYDSKSRVPVRDIIEIYEYIRLWALDNIEDFNNKIERLENSATKSNTAQKEADLSLLNSRQKPYIALQEQCRRLILVLEALPDHEKMLSFLQLERIIKAIYEPTQMVFRQTECDHLPFVYNPSAILSNTDHTLWWNFIDNGQNAGFDFWYKTEYECLNNIGIFPEKPEQKNKRLLWQRKNAVLKTCKNILLIIPGHADGKAVNPHPLWGDLHAAFGKSLKKLIVKPEEFRTELLDKMLKSPDFISIDKIPSKNTASFLYVNNEKQRLKARDTETFSGLESLIYYPYQWVFRYVLGLHKSSILSIVKPETLKGNLAHSIFEKILNETNSKNKVWEKTNLFDFLEVLIPQLIEREAAVLMMYGQESERRAFINMMKQACWALLSAIQRNNWQIVGPEQQIEGLLGNQLLKGKADLILQRSDEKAVVDLKISGSERYKKKIKNRDDIQLLIYSKFAAEAETWAKSAYFIISRAQLLAANNDAFEEAVALLPDEDSNSANNFIWEKLQKTYEWRIAQIQEGKIEIRTDKTLDDLEAMYNNEAMLSLLELPRESAKYDIYNVLIASED